MRGNLKAPPSQRDGQVEDGEHRGAAVVGEQVSDDGGRDGGVAGLSDAYQASGQHEQPVVLQTERDKQSDASVRHQLEAGPSHHCRCELQKCIPQYDRQCLEVLGGGRLTDC